LLELGLGVRGHPQALDDDIDTEVAGQIDNQAREGIE
jgi:hypothetical protein